MKKKIIKLWGIGMIVVLMASLLVVGATPAAAAPLAWSNLLTLPAGVPFNQLVAGSNVANVTVAPNGHLFAIDSATPTLVYKSVDGGTTWTPSVPIAGAVVDLAVSPSYATDNTIVALGAGPPAQVYISVNGGITYSPLGAALTALEVGTSIAISPNYIYPTGEIMVGTQQPAAGVEGDVYIWGRLGTLAWTAMALAEDVTDVAYSTNYLIDATRLAVGSIAATGTRLHTLVASDAAFDVTLPVVAVIDALTRGTGDATALTDEGIIASSIAIPSDFNASVVFGRNCYVAIIGTDIAPLITTDNVYRLGVGSAVPAVALNPGALLGYADNEMTSLVHTGTYAAGKLYAGDLNSTLVFQTSNPTAPAGFTSWTWSLAAPTGVGTTYVALAADYATTNTVYAGTAGANSALSVATDGGVFFHQTGMIATAINGITDLAVTSATEMYMVTMDNTVANVESLWKSDNAGVTWYRILSWATGANNGIVRISESYATDNTLVFADIGTVNFLVSMDRGATWVPRTLPAGTIADMIVKDAYTYYVGLTAGGVQSTTNGGWVWQIFATGTGGFGVNDMAYDAGTGHILVGCANGNVYLSTNGNALYLLQGNIGAGPAIVEFDTGYATNNTIYGAATTIAGVMRYNTTTPLVPWAAIVALPTTPSDIVCAPDGTLYVSDSTANGGMQRSLNPTAFIFPGSPAFEAVAGGAFGDGLTAGSTLVGKLSLVEGSNILYSINGALLTISTYTDTLTTAIPAVVSPAEGDIVLAGAAAVSIAPVAGNPFGAYQVQWNVRPDYLGVGNTIAFPAVINSVNLNAVGIVIPPAAAGVAVAVPAGATIYFRVQTTATVFGPWSDTMTFETQLTAGAINAPAILSPIANGTGPGGYGAALNPTFNWGVIGGATNYGFELASDASFDDPILSLTGDDALGNILVYKLTTMTLEYGTTYYWRVMGISATSETAWSAAVGFTTMDEPVVEEPVVVTDAPDIIITIPAQDPAPTYTLVPPAVEDTAQGYIWAIIIIGAVLVIAVIVLIVRTRRSV